MGGGSDSSARILHAGKAERSSALIPGSERRIGVEAITASPTAIHAARHAGAGKRPRAGAVDVIFTVRAFWPGFRKHPAACHCAGGRSRRPRRWVRSAPIAHPVSDGRFTRSIQRSNELRGTNDTFPICGSVASGDALSWATRGSSLADAHPQQFGLIVLDAFSSDAIPIHLLTEQALSVYLSRLAPEGVIAAFTSRIVI